MRDPEFSHQPVIFLEESGLFYWIGDSPRAGAYRVTYAERIDGMPQLLCSPLLIAPSKFEDAEPESEIGAVRGVKKTDRSQVSWFSHVNGKVIAGPYETVEKAMNRARREALIREWQLSDEGFYLVSSDEMPNPEDIDIRPDAS